MPPQDAVEVPVELDVALFLGFGIQFQMDFVLILGFGLGVHTLKHESFTKSQLALRN